jgi:predicted permease
MNWENGLVQDIKFALRQLRKNPGFTTVAALTLALGIGGNTAIFCLIDAVMLRTLPVKDPGQLVLLKWKSKRIPQTKSSSSYANCPPGSGPASEGGDIISDVPLDAGGCSFSFPFFEQVRAGQNVFSNVAAFVPAEVSVNSDGRTSRVPGLFVSGGFFSMLGAKAAIGRLLDRNDDSEAVPPGLVVSHRFWQNELGGDRLVVGKQVLIGKTRFTVVGVTGQEFAQLDPGLPCDLWVPLAFRDKVPPYPPPQMAPNAIWLEIMGRLGRGVSTTQAASALSGTFSVSTTSGPDAILKPNDVPEIELASAARGLATLRRNFSQVLFALLAAVGLVLLISCVNIAGLMLARSASRRKEFGMRLSLGASRGRIISQLLTESLVLSSLGGAIGAVLGSFGARILVTFFSRNWSTPLRLDVRPDTHILVFTSIVSVGVGIACGLLPAFSAGRADLVLLLKLDNRAAAIGTRRKITLGSLIVLVQIALAVPILAGAGLVARTLVNLEAENLGFNPQDLVVFRIDSTYSRTNPKAPYRELQESLSSLPGVTSVGRSGVALLSNEGMAAPIFAEGQLSAQARAHYLPMSSNFFATMGMRLREGQVFSDQDQEQGRGKNVPTKVVVNETLVRHLFGSRDPLGRLFHVGSEAGPAYEIVGVVSDAKYGNVREPVWPTVYGPIAAWDGPMYFEIRTAMDPRAIISEIRRNVAGFDSNLLIADMKTENEQIAQDLYQERLISALSGSYAVLALSVAGIGLYGLLAFQVARRTQEIGIRLALGAQRQRVLGLVLWQGALLAVFGTVVGCAAAWGVTRYMESFLYGVRAADPLTLVAVIVFLVGVSVMASYIPARQASKIEPIVALRCE